MNCFEQNKPVIAEWARRVANDESLEGLEHRFTSDLCWSIVVSPLRPDWDIYLYRFAPKTVTINGYEVVAPMSEKPKHGEDFYYFDQGCEDLVFKTSWYDSYVDRQIFEFGIFDNKEDARRYGLALHNIDPNTPVEEL